MLMADTGNFTEDKMKEYFRNIVLDLVTAVKIPAEHKNIQTASKI